MPNIVFVGHLPLGMRDDVSRIVTQLGIDATKGVITYDPYLCCIDMTAMHGEAPYLIVRDTNKKEAMKIATTLNDKLEIDVEIEVLWAFLPKKRGKK